jgi:hypothetical protein
MTPAMARPRSARPATAHHRNWNQHHGLRLGDPRVHALLAALCVFRLLPRGFAHHDLRPILVQLDGTFAESITPGKMTYDLRRLPSGAHRTHSAQLPLPGHRHRPRARPVPHPAALTGSCAPVWPASPDRNQQPRPGRRHPRLHHRYRRPRLASQPRHLTPRVADPPSRPARTGLDSELKTKATQAS